MTDLTCTNHLGDEMLAADYLKIGAGDAPCSRYGLRTEEHTPIILAVARILEHETGEPLTPDTLDHCASLVVNDHDDPQYLIENYGTDEERAALAEVLR